MTTSSPPTLRQTVADDIELASPNAIITQALQRYWSLAQQGEPRAVLLLGDEISDPATVLSQWLDTLLTDAVVSTSPPPATDLPITPATDYTQYRMPHPLVLRLAPNYHEATPVGLLTMLLTMISHVAQRYIYNAYHVLQPLFIPLQLDWTIEAFRLALLSAVTGSLNTNHKNDSPDQATMPPVLQRLMSAIRVDVPVVKKLTFSIKAPQTCLAQAMFDPWLLAFSALTGSLAGLPPKLKGWMALLHQDPNETTTTSNLNIDTALEAVIGIFDWLEQTVQQCQPETSSSQALGGPNLLLPSILIALPHWERVADLPQADQDLWKQTLNRWLQHWQDKPTNKGYNQPKRRLLMLISCSTNNLGVTTGASIGKQGLDSHLFQTCRHKLLLPSSNAQHQQTKDMFTRQWQQFLLKLSSNEPKAVDLVLSLLAQCLNEPCTRWGLGFTVAQLIGQLPLGVSPQAVFNVLHHCFTQGWITQVTLPAKGVITPLWTDIELNGVDDPPRYQWASPNLWRLLCEQVNTTLTSSTLAQTAQCGLNQERLATLTTALQAGCLSPEITANLAYTPDLIATLESLFQSLWANTNEEGVLVRLNILHNWAVLPLSTPFIHALTHCISGVGQATSHKLLKDYAARLSANVLSLASNNDTPDYKTAKLDLLHAVNESLMVLEEDPEIRTVLCHTVTCAMAGFTAQASPSLTKLLADPEVRVRRSAFTGLLTHALPPISTLSNWVKQGLDDQNLLVVEAVLQILNNKQLDSTNQTSTSLSLIPSTDATPAWSTYWQTILSNCQSQLLSLLDQKALSPTGVNACVHLLLSTGITPSALTDLLESTFQQAFTQNTNRLKHLSAWVKALLLQNNVTIKEALPVYHGVFIRGMAQVLSQQDFPQVSVLWGVLNMWDKQLELAIKHRLSIEAPPQHVLAVLIDLLEKPQRVGVSLEVRSLLTMVCQRLVSKLTTQRLPQMATVATVTG
jgi:hypothetical protein